MQFTAQDVDQAIREGGFKAMCFQRDCDGGVGEVVSWWWYDSAHNAITLLHRCSTCRNVDRFAFWSLYA